MKKSLFLFLALLTTTTAFAQEAPLFLGQNAQEAALLQQLSKRRQELDMRAENLNTREGEVLKKEKLYEQAPKSTLTSSPLPREVQLYMQMKPAKAAALLDKKTTREAALILEKMPAVYAARILDKMTDEKAAALIEKAPFPKE